MGNKIGPLYLHRFWLRVHQKNNMVLALILALLAFSCNYFMNRQTQGLHTAFVQMMQTSLPSGQAQRLPAMSAQNLPATAPLSTQEASAQVEDQFKQLVGHPSQVITVLLLWLALVLINQTTFWWGFKHGALNTESFQKASVKEIISLMVGVLLGTILSCIAVAILIGGIILFKAFNLHTAIIIIFVILGAFLFLRWWYAAFASMAISGKAQALLSFGQWKDAFKTLKTVNLFKIFSTHLWSMLIFMIYGGIILGLTGIVLTILSALGRTPLTEFGLSAVGVWLGITGTTAVGYYLG
ncbi:MAG: hypothetical protein J6Y94_08350, partial [Bacteriovoracaceae bacterium]|nr:hypothetical protein [Bacteriovoracaceae bacterium]